MQLKPKDIPAYRTRRLLANGNTCDLCHEPIVSPCADHDHKSGHLRGTICRSCNSVLGKLERGNRYGKNFNVLAFAKNVYDYLTRPTEGLIHPTHGKPKRRPRTRK